MFKITVRTARNSCGYAEEEVAKYCCISVDTLLEHEADSKWMSLSLICKILTMYGTSSSLIHFGTEADCIEYNKSRMAKWSLVV